MAFELKYRKDISQLQSDAAHSTDLTRTLGPMNLINLGIGAIIGAGLFSLTGIAAAEHAGPAVSLSFVLAAIGCALVAAENNVNNHQTPRPRTLRFFRHVDDLHAD